MFGFQNIQKQPSYRLELTSLLVASLIAFQSLPTWAGTPAGSCAGEVAQDLITESQADGKEFSEAREYVAERQKGMMKRGKAKLAAIKASMAKGKSTKVDVVAIGAGPHTGMALSGLRGVAPRLRALVFEASDKNGVFNQLGGFDVNTVEEADASGNTIAASPVQVKHFNFFGYRFVPAEVFGFTTVLSHLFSNSTVIYGERVVKVTERPSGENWPGRYRVESSSGAVVYTDHIIIGVGMGTPSYRISDAESAELVRAELAKNASHQADPNYEAGILSVDEYLAIQFKRRYRKGSTDSSSTGVSGNEHESEKTYAVIGAGDGGAIAVEGALGLNMTLNPKGLAYKTKVFWMGQKAKTGDEYYEALPSENRKKRYGRARVGYDQNRLFGLERAQKIERVVENGVNRFKVYYGPTEGGPYTGFKVVDHVIFATGYESLIPTLLKGMTGGDGKQVGYSLIKQSLDGYTRYPELAHESPVGLQVSVGGKEQQIYAIGNSADIKGTGYELTHDELNIAVGGYLDLLGARSAALGAWLAKGFKTQPKIVLKAGSSVASKSVNLPQVAPVTSEIEASCDLRVQMASALLQYQFPSNSAVKVDVFKMSDLSHLKVSVSGLQPLSADEIIQRLSNNSQFLESAQIYLRTHSTDSISGVATSHSDGRFRPEDLKVNGQ